MTSSAWTRWLRRSIPACAAAAAFAVWLAPAPVIARQVEVATAPQAAASLPDKLSDKEFWKIVSEFSEESGYFQSDNLVGNERPLQNVVPALREMKRGGVYLGVAPDQNFTYIAALEPKMAFIVDIRRGNLLAHLMYKAIFEMSDDRADFLSMLFSRKRPRELSGKSTPAELFAAFRAAEPDETLFNDNLRRITERLTKTHGFDLSEADFSGNGGLNYVYGMFFRYGPELTYASSGSGGRGGRNNMPTYADLQQATDMEGRNHAYLSDEEHFGILKKLEERNLLVPVVGDFAGPKALRAVGKYIADHGATVTAYYTSNVEQYLFQNGVWPAFYTNVSTLPLEDTSVFIRSARGSNLLDPIRSLLTEFSERRIQIYSDVTRRGSIK